MEKSRDATDEANVRSAIAEVTAAVLADDKTDSGDVKYTAESNTYSVTVTATGKKAGWSGVTGTATAIKIGGIDVKPSTTGWTVTGTITSSDKDAEVTVKEK